MERDAEVSNVGAKPFAQQSQENSVVVVVVVVGGVEERDFVQADETLSKCLIGQGDFNARPAGGASRFCPVTNSNLVNDCIQNLWLTRFAAQVSSGTLSTQITEYL